MFSAILLKPFLYKLVTANFTELRNIYHAVRFNIMSFANQTLRTKWPELVESPALDSVGVRSVAGWLKQASLEVRHAASTGLSKMSSMVDSPNTVTIIHFNDVYNVDSREAEPCGGAAKFVHLVKSFSHLKPLVLFSGDIFSPSTLSTFTKGEQMSQILNEIGTHCAVFGNHDFDFGLEVLAERVSETKFPWLMSNVIDNESGRPLGDGKITHVIDWNGKRIGLIGLVEQEWIDTLATINADELTFMDFVDVAQKLGSQLKEEGCDYVIALTHMRTRNDKKLAEQTTDVDLILGGHDHVYEVQKINDKFIVKSGTDFRQFSKITIDFQDTSHAVNIEEVNVIESIPEDMTVKSILEKYEDTVMGKMNEVLGTFSVPLEGRFSKIRTEETNLGNWICDILLAATGSDLVVINSGTFRSDQVHSPGPFTLGDLMRIIPYNEPTVELNVSGETLVQILENGVCKWPELEGRFPQVAGVRFAFDPTALPGKRVDPLLVRIGDEYLVMDQYYRLSTKSYLHNGCDGYIMFPHAEILVGPEICPELSLSIQNHFAAIKMRQGKCKRLSKHRQSLVTLSRRHSLVKQLEGSELDGPSPIRRNSHANSADHHHLHHHHHHGQMPLPKLYRRASLDDLESESCLLAPTVEGRIIILTPEIRKELYLERDRLMADNTIIPEVEESESPQHSVDKSD